MDVGRTIHRTSVNTTELAPESFLVKVGGETECIEGENRNRRHKN